MIAHAHVIGTSIRYGLQRYAADVLVVLSHCRNQGGAWWYAEDHQLAPIIDSMEDRGLVTITDGEDGTLLATITDDGARWLREMEAAR